MNTELLENINNKYCVPKEIIVSILLVETLLGDIIGEKRAFNTLASMALSMDLETIRPYLPKKLINPRNDASARCAGSGLTQASWIDDRVGPTPGEARAYLVRRSNRLGPGTYGESSAFHDLRDALDVASPCP